MVSSVFREIKNNVRFYFVDEIDISQMALGGDEALEDIVKNSISIYVVRSLNGHM